MNLKFFLRMLAAQSRGARGRSLFFVACVAVGVAAVVGVAALVDAVEQGIRVRSRELLGGDLSIEARTPLPDVMDFLPPPYASTRLPRAELRILSTMIRGDRGDSRLAELKAIETVHARYPLAGELELSPNAPLHTLLDDHSVVVAPAVLQELGLRLGDTLHIGGQAFRIRASIVREPDPLTFSFSFGPRVLLTKAALERTGLLGMAHRARYRTLLRLPAGTSNAELSRVQAHLEAHLPGGGVRVKIETHAQAQPALRRTLDRVQGYLGLVALLSLLIASVGVAQIVSAWLAQASPQTAILRCLGLRPREVLLLYLGQVVLLAVLGSALGALVGASLPALALQAYPELAPPQLMAALPLAALARGMLLGVGVALVFSLPPLTAVWQVSPALVLRAEAAPLPVPRVVRSLAQLALFAGVLLSAYAQTLLWTHAFAFAIGVSVLAGLLWLGARGLLLGIGRLPRARLPVLIWQGAAALARPAAGAAGSIVALGMGALVVLGITLVQDILAREIVTALPPNAPSVFLLDVQPDQWSQVQQIAEDAGAQNIQSVPVIMARLRSIDGRSVDELVKERSAAQQARRGDRGGDDTRDDDDERRQRDQAGGAANEQDRERWVLTREQRVTSLRELPESNRLLQGELWHKPGVQEISIESEFARDLGATLGTRLSFDVQGVPVDFEVTSIRSVDWRSFSVNFFLIAEPGSLDDAPQFLLGAARVPQAAEQRMQNQLAKTLPNVTVLRVQAMLDRASALLGQVALGVRLLGAFAVATGLIILAGAVASSQLRRAREAALLKTLGLTRAQVASMFAIEYALAGAVAGAIAAVGAYALAVAFTRGTLELQTQPSIPTCLIGWLVTIVLSVLAGLLASTRALQAPPLEVLRQE